VSVSFIHGNTDAFMACFGLAHEDTVRTVSAFATDMLNGPTANDRAAAPTPTAFNKLDFFISNSPFDSKSLLFL
jgi:hypothetical protein